MVVSKVCEKTFTPLDESFIKVMINPSKLQKTNAITNYINTSLKVVVSLYSVKSCTSDINKKVI